MRIKTMFRAVDYADCQSQIWYLLVFATRISDCRFNVTIAQDCFVCTTPDSKIVKKFQHHFGFKNVVVYESDYENVYFIHVDD